MCLDGKKPFQNNARESLAVVRTKTSRKNIELISFGQMMKNSFFDNWLSNPNFCCYCSDPHY